MSFVGTTPLSTDYEAQAPKNSFADWIGVSRWRQIDRKDEEGKKISLIDEGLAQQALDRSRPTQASTLTAYTITGLAITEGSLSLARHVGRAVPSIDPQNSAIVDLGYVTGGIGLFLGSFVKVKGGIENLQRACQIGDGEGKSCAGAAIVSGTLSSSASGLFIANTASAISGIGLAANGLFGLGSLLNMGISGLGAYRCCTFRTDIAEILENKNLTETERLVKAIEFLKDKVAPSRLEREAILKDTNGLYRNLSEESREGLMRQKLIDLAEVKIESLKRRTSQAAIEKIVEQADPLLNRLRKDPTPRDLEAAREFLADVQKENRKRMLLFAVAAVISAIAFAGLIAGTFFSLGTLPFALYAISAAIGLAMVFYPLLAHPERKEKDLAARSVEMLPAVIIEDPTPA